MAKFKQVPHHYLLGKLMEYWRNMVRNYNGDVRDSDFFDIIGSRCPHETALKLIKGVYSRNELKEMETARSRLCRLNLSDGLESIFQALWNHKGARAKCKAALEGVYGCIVKDIGRRTGRPEPIEGRFSEITRLLKLSDLEKEILILSYVKARTCFDWPIRIDDHEKPLYYAMALDRSYAEVSTTMTANGRLRKFGLLDDDWDFNWRVLDGYMDGSDSEALERRFYRKCEEEDVLPWKFFGDLAAKDGAVIKEMVKAARGKCNILLYGAPGTGKTSFARTLAKELGLVAFEVRQGDEDGKNMKSEARMVGIQVCNEQEDAEESLMIVDEADELLRGRSGGFSIFGFPVGGGKSTEKGVMNSILDEMKIPAIWISNAAADSMDESVRRRFDYSVCFEKMNSAQRASIWRNLVKKHRLGRLVPEDRIEEYASKYETSAGGISIVLDNVKRMAPRPGRVDELIATLMKPHCRLMGIKGGNGFLPAKGYSLDGLNIKGKVGLDKVVGAVRNYLDAGFNAGSEDKPRMNILMFGPPGTGKTEFVKYLGRELDRKVLVVKGSDILSKWVGGSEQNIAAAFRTAESERAILFFDEIDGLVQSRERATTSWQVSQVNELLQQMENFDGVMIAATNFCKNLDPAIMRRFTFKLEFGYLDDEGKRTFFERMFRTTLSEDELAELNALRNLAPGDFRTVRQEQFYLAGAVTNLDRIAALKEECALKKDGEQSSRIGFAA